MLVIYKNVPVAVADQAEHSATFPLVQIHLGPGEVPKPKDFVSEAVRALRRGVVTCNVERAVNEATSLILIASQTAKREGGWGCSALTMRRAFQQVEHPAVACAELAEDEKARNTMLQFIDALKFTLRSFAPNHAA
jgi:hypothetical protein